MMRKTIATILFFDFIIFSVNCYTGDEVKVLLTPCDYFRTSFDKRAHFVCNGLQNEQDLLKFTYLSNIVNNTFDFNIINSSVSYIPSEAFKGLKLHKLCISNSVIGALTDADVAFSGLEQTLNVLQIENCTLMSTWEWSLFKNLKKLAYLTASGVDLTAVQKIEQAEMEQVTFISLENNKISFIHDEAFADCKNLSLLKLDFNEISTLKRSMFPNPAQILWKLTLKQNNIHFLPEDMFVNMPLLVTLDLSYNKILTLKRETFLPVWMGLSDLDLSGNKLTCDCRLRWMLLIPPPLRLKATCSVPENLEGMSLTNLTAIDIWC